MSDSISNEFENWSVDDLRLIPPENFVDDDGSVGYAVYSFKLDALTFVTEQEAHDLKARGVGSLDDLPE